MAGIVIAFQKFIPARGLLGDQKWIGLDNFLYVANLPHAARAFRNSLIIASLKIVFGLVVPIVVALLLNEVRIKGLRRTIQTVIYLSHFLSWVILDVAHHHSRDGDGHHPHRRPQPGLIEAQYGPATAVGLFQSAVALILISASYYLAYRFANYRIF